MEQAKAFLSKDLFVVKGLHFTVGVALAALAVYWFVLRRK